MDKRLLSLQKDAGRLKDDIDEVIKGKHSGEALAKNKKATDDAVATVKKAKEILADESKKLSEKTLELVAKRKSVNTRISQLNEKIKGHREAHVVYCSSNVEGNKKIAKLREKLRVKRAEIAKLKGKSIDD